MAANSDAGLGELWVRSDRFPPVPVAARPRNRYAPVYVGQDVGAVWLRVAPRDPSAAVAVNGRAVEGGAESGPVELSPGRNVVVVEVTAVDGATRNVFRPHIFRDYPGPAWRRIRETSPWIPRDSAGELVFGGRMWLFGGFTPPTVGDVWSSPDGVEWTRTGEIPGGRGVDIPLTFVFRDRMWVTDVDGNLFSSADGVVWTLATDRAPWRGRSSAGAAVFAGRMWVMGGAVRGAFLNDIWSSGNGIDWMLERENAPWSRRILHNTPLVLDGRLWLVGGAAVGDYHPFRPYTDVWSSPDGRRWERATDEAPWAGRIWGSTAVYRDRLWLLGGFRPEPVWENLGDVWYSPDGADWRRLDFPAVCRHAGTGNVPVSVDGSIWAPRHEMSVHVHDDRLWTAGGMVWPLVNDVWCLDIPGLTFVTRPVVEEFVGTRYIYRARADFNRSRSAIRYRLVEGPAWLAVDARTGVIGGTAAAPGDVRVSVEASDVAGETARQSYTLHVLSPGESVPGPANPAGA